MFEKLEIFRMAHAMSVHAGARQAVVAQNMANADTPGYAARDVQPFKEIVESGDAGFVPRATRPDISMPRLCHLTSASATGVTPWQIQMEILSRSRPR